VKPVGREAKHSLLEGIRSVLGLKHVILNDISRFFLRTSRRRNNILNRPRPFFFKFLLNYHPVRF